MLVARFGPSTAWHGREIIWDVDHFILVGHGRIPAAGVLDYDRLGQLQWERPELRSWVAAVNQWERGTAPAATYSPVGAGVATPAGATSTRGFPAWGYVVIAVVAAMIVLGAVFFIVVPQFVLRTGETLTNDWQVRAGVETIQSGVEAYAAEHGGTFPRAGEVNSVGLARYISSWPWNPYTDLPMADGGGAGNFRYDLSPDGGMYKLIGYGRDGTVIITLSGGSDTSV